MDLENVWWAMQSGKLITIFVAVLGLLAAAGALWFRYQHGNRAKAFWGLSNALIVRDEPQVSLWRLNREEPDVKDEQTLTFFGREWTVRGQIDVAQAPGLQHVRQALLEDRSYDWAMPPTSSYAKEIVALAFGDPPKLVVVIDVASKQLAYRSERASIAPMATFLRRWTTGVLPDRKDSTSGETTPETL